MGKIPERLCVVLEDILGDGCTSCMLKTDTQKIDGEVDYGHCKLMEFYTGEEDKIPKGKDFYRHKDCPLKPHLESLKSLKL